MNTPNSAAPRVLLVEDEVMVSMMLEDLLERAGYRVITASNLDDALRLAQSSDMDVAVLDVNLDGELSFPVADILRARGIAFTFASGYGTDGVSAGYRSENMLQKPYDIKTLLNELSRLRANVERVGGTG
ncbi:response regulator [Rhodanobacter sp. AS-Z3]|uniref:response regulator n=1 Tax=Rhodanobacter sp. AS-Z3 TaxID=3031330 RepID=UPI002478651C|nr:response regulator [Rhodanobacter sp. AS-Z3]WEN14251.1 response regulator [Rhodanobacter sp. AS-Z3]